MNPTEAQVYIANAGENYSQPDNPTVAQKQALMDCPHCKQKWDPSKIKIGPNGLYKCPSCNRDADTNNYDKAANAFNPEEMRDSHGKWSTWGEPTKPGLKPSDDDAIPSNDETPVYYEFKRSAGMKHATESPAFKAWFAGSKVVDSNGEPLVMFHGTMGAHRRGDGSWKDTGVITEFDPSKQGGSGAGYRGAGHYFANNPDLAAEYAKGYESERGAILKNKGAVLPVYLSVRNPLVLQHYHDDYLDKIKSLGYVARPRPEEDERRDADGGYVWFAEDNTRFLKERGYDGVIEYNEKHIPVEVNCFDPNQIKSIYNRGTWNPHDRNISNESAETIMLRIANGDIKEPLPVNHRVASIAILRGAALHGFAGWLQERAGGILAHLQAKLVALAKGVPNTGNLFRDAEQAINTEFASIEAVILSSLKSSVPAVRDMSRLILKEHGTKTTAGNYNPENLLIAGTDIHDTIKKFAADTLYKFKATIRASLANEEPNSDLIKRLDGTWLSGNSVEWYRFVMSANAGNSLDVVVDFIQSVTSSFEKMIGMAAQALAKEVDEESLEGADDEMTLGWQWVAVLDDKVCDRCSALDGSQWNEDYEPVGDSEEYEEDPPLHPNCRCSKVMINLDEEPAPEKGRLDTYFDGVSKEVRDATFGKASSDAYDRGEISARSMLDSGQKLSPDDLSQIAKFMGE